MNKLKLTNKQTHETNNYVDVSVTAVGTKPSITDYYTEDSNAFCKNKRMQAMVLNKYWHDSERDEYEIVAYLSKDFFDRYSIADKDSINHKTKVVSAENDVSDPVNKPPHYNKGGVECIDYIKQQLGSNFPAYLEGNAVKYLHRHKFKNSNIQDLKKSVWYINKLIEHYKNL